MKSKSSVEDAAVQAVSVTIDSEKKSEICHNENVETPPMNKIPVSADLTPKEQYKQVDIEARLAVIKQEIEMQDGEAHNASQTSWKAIFSKEHRSRTLVAVLELQSQNFSGGYFASKALIGGGTILCFWSIIIAGTSMAGTSNTAANTALLAFMTTWSILYTGAVGFFGWAVAQETASQSTRPKTIAFTVVCQQLTALLFSSVFPYFINPD
ncbi:hypothetical protein G7Y89_g9620 [Cudoniella acicularis]|uniref:Uncharacterized protein n=1 Tax=Cudoniella acicularis TaxID=354080 RepID=A0A8H4REB5_9HELO|nr:hypothetical protein G7Y89_g9620 [Cudoniella acicularis]